jgi:hypothetical protein
MALTILAVAGSLLSPISGVTNLAAIIKGVGVVPLVDTAIKYKKARRKVLLAHDISWLYSAKQGRFALR